MARPISNPKPKSILLDELTETIQSLRDRANELEMFMKQNIKDKQKVYYKCEIIPPAKLQEPIKVIKYVGMFQDKGPKDWMPTIIGKRSKVVAIPFEPQRVDEIEKIICLELGITFEEFVFEAVKYIMSWEEYKNYRKYSRQNTANRAHKIKMEQRQKEQKKLLYEKKSRALKSIQKGRNELLKDITQGRTEGQKDTILSWIHNTDLSI